jgi:hypothetical protein
MIAPLISVSQRINFLRRRTCPRHGAVPPNNGMQLTAKSVTPFAWAEGAPLLSAADPRR